MEANFHPLFTLELLCGKHSVLYIRKKPLTYLKSLIAWILVMIFARKTEKSELPNWIFIVANIIAATAFAAGHLSATLMLSDQEYLDFLSAYSQLIQKHLTNEPSGGRKARKITFISSPT